MAWPETVSGLETSFVLGLWSRAGMHHSKFVMRRFVVLVCRRQVKQKRRVAWQFLGVHAQRSFVEVCADVLWTSLERF